MTAWGSATVVRASSPNTSANTTVLAYDAGCSALDRLIELSAPSFAFF